MSKFKIVLISIFTIALIILTSAVVYQNIKYDKLAKEEEKVTDECIYENNEIENDIDEIKVSETETKVSPNAELVIKKYYKECGHTTEEKRNVANDMVNKTQEEIEKLYPDYKVESFFNNKIVLIKENLIVLLFPEKFIISLYILLINTVILLTDIKLIIII